MAFTMKIVCSALAVFTLFATVSGSAIPMWEFLSREEKMSHLVAMFARQVQTFCKTRTDMVVSQCKRELLNYGVNQLQGMTDTHMDVMDPYQRGASDLVWEALMQGHPTSNVNPQKKQTTTEMPIYYPTGNFVHNPIFDEPATGVSSKNGMESYAMDMDVSYDTPAPGAGATVVAYPEPVNHLSAPTNVEPQYESFSRGTYLEGPMVVRVHPDGRQVEEDKNKPLPKDDDRDDMTFGQRLLPPFTRSFVPSESIRRDRFVQAPVYSNYRFVYNNRPYFRH